MMPALPPCLVLGLVVVGVLLALGDRAAAQDQPLEMVFIPPGDFEMGTSEEEVAALAREYGVHPSLFQVETARRRAYVKGFLIDRYPVTNAQYARFLEATGRRAPFTWPGGKYPEGQDDYPVTGVSWDAAAAYAAWAGKRLPAAEEWEKAARGTDGRVYPWGNEWRDDACWTDDPTCPQALARTTPVGAFPAGASPYGVMDLCGSVAEWTSTDAVPPNEQLNWHWYVVKGAGGAHSQHYNFRCAARAFTAHQSRCHAWLGFRCARDADEAPADLAPPRATPLLPDPPSAPGPDLGALNDGLIRVTPTAGHGAILRAPFLPVGSFALNVPEQVGAQGLPLGWSMAHDPYQWRTSEDQTRADYLCTWPDKAEMAVVIECGSDAVTLTISLRNLTAEAMKSPQTNVCLNPHGSPYFEDPERIRTMVWTDEGPVSVYRMPAGGPGEPMHTGWNVATPDQTARPEDGRVRYPIICTRSRDGQFILAHTCAQGTSVASNAHYSCLHSRPLWPDIAPGEEVAVTSRLYFMRGGPEDLLARWRYEIETPGMPGGEE